MNINFSKSKIFTEYLMLAFSSIYLAILLYSTYEMGVYTKLEEIVSDVKIRLKPQYVDQDDIAVITISDEDIRNFEGKNNVPLSPKSLDLIVQAALKSTPNTLGIVLPSQDFSYKDKNLISLLKKYENTPKLFWGDFDATSFATPVYARNKTIGELPNNVHSANTYKIQASSIIRNLNLKDYRGSAQNLHFITKIALEYVEDNKKEEIKSLYRNKPIKDATIKINYSLPHTFQTIESYSLVKNGANEKLKNKIVLIGYTAFRNSSKSHQESTYRKTPWQDESSEIDQVNSMPTIYILANGIKNLIHQNMITEIPYYYSLLQTLLVTLLCLSLWRANVIKAFSLLILLISFLTIIHVSLLTLFSLEVPAGNTIIFSFVATIVGAFWRAQKDTKTRSEKYLKSVYQKKVASVQESFLNKFANEIYEFNFSVKRLISKHEKYFVNNNNHSLSSVYTKAISSNLELEEYLDGIRQYASLDSKSINTTNKEPINLVGLISKVLKKFESKVIESNVKIHFNTEKILYGWSDIVYLEPILFNLISNAIKYSLENGNIFISVLEVDSKTYSISVRDEGPGIPEELIGRIFEKFYRIRDDNVYKVKGNGLGLYLAQFFAQKMGTKIEVVSEVGKGSIFSIKLEKFNK